ncbi:hypothetical protein LTR01_004972 [Friedmanniomyces endolithicus]|nr:hypothetical protein LTR01_004972 [Friedmanniomyces endolithicus]KAK0825175.1 hypothetical protein LTR73_007129 [Friedmanniomyces endolithicus]
MKAKLTDKIWSYCLPVSIPRDPRNIIKSIAAIPGTYSNSIFVTVNDIDFDIVARNAIMLLIVITEPDNDNAVDCMLHVWYSSNIQQKHLELLEAKIRPPIENVILKIVNKAAGSLQRKTWKLGNNTFSLTLVKEQWSLLLRYLEVPTGVTEPVARHVRTAVTMTRRDHIDRSYLAQLPPHRVCMERFRANGILLPFGESTEAFKIPNPSITPALSWFARFAADSVRRTFYQTAAWPMMDSADPLDGWDWREVLKTSSGLATNDLYGKLVVYLRRLFFDFHNVLQSHVLTFSLFNTNAGSLPHHLPKNNFARIEVSNIVDRAYLGIEKTLGLLGPLLQPPSVNPHAAMLTLFMNAIPEILSEKEQKNIAKPEMELAMQYMTKVSPARLFGGNMAAAMQTEIIKMMGASVLVRDVDKYFNMYMKQHGFDMFPAFMQMVPREPNTIIEKWPLRLKLLPHEKGAKEEFNSLLSSSHTGIERYVEWSRTK